MTLQVEPTKSCQKRDPTMESREKESGVALDRFKPASSGGRVCGRPGKRKHL